MQLLDAAGPGQFRVEWSNRSSASPQDSCRKGCTDRAPVGAPWGVGGRAPGTSLEVGARGAPHVRTLAVHGGARSVHGRCTLYLDR